MIGIFGGTFDPVHFGHLRPALEVKQALGLREMRLIPAYQPPHREPPVANPGQRLTMLRAAVGGETDLLVDAREMQREGPSYMVDTLSSLREELGDEPLCLVLGSDAFLQLDSWHQWQRIAELAHIVVTHRPGWALDIDAASPALQQLWRERHTDDASELAKAPAGKIILQAVTPLEISATAIRALVAAGQNPRYLVPEPVWNLIRMQGLYGFSSDTFQKTETTKLTTQSAQ
jgi:nicotinate-nucleotide adenylyltransferase